MALEWRIGALTQGAAWWAVAAAADRRPAPGRGPHAGLLRAAGACQLAADAALVVGMPATIFGALAWTGLAVLLPMALCAYPYEGPTTAADRRAATALLVIGAIGIHPDLVSYLGAQDVSRGRGWVAVVQFVVLASYLWWRAEQSGTGTRTRLLWLLFGTSAFVLVAGHLVFLADPLRLPEPLMMSVALTAALVVPVCAAIGLAIPRRYDARRALSGLVVWTTMIDLTVSLVTGGLAGLSLVTGGQPTKAAVAVVATTGAVVFGPLLARVRRVTEDVLFGGSTDPLQAMTRLGVELGADSSPQAWAEALRAALVVPRVELRTAEALLAAAGAPGGTTEVTPLLAGGEHVGDLVVALPPDVSRLRPGPRAVLNLVAAPLARALQAVRLAEDLRASRERVVEAREEERRRIRRDLHDGLGPVLTGVGYTADAALNVLRTRPEQTARLLSQLRSDTSDAIHEVRRIVEGLRPPALDEVGLAAALRQRAVRYSGRLDVAVLCSVPAAEGPDLLPAAVEVVAYRVASEAMTNSARHAVPRPGRACLRVTVNLTTETVAGADHLVVTVEDDGAPADQWTTGTGLASMAARCDEVGGTVRSGAYDGGWRVQAWLPLPT